MTYYNLVLFRSIKQSRAVNQKIFALKDTTILFTEHSLGGVE